MNALVTGGGGFVGRAVVERLVARGDCVRTLARGDYPDLRAQGVETLRGDIRDADILKNACRNCDVVFHAAAMLPLGGRYADFFAVNVLGTRNVIAACRAAGVGRLVYTSTPSVVFTGRDMEGANESTPYPPQHHDNYAATKTLAERDVLAASDFNLHTVALRPHLIWGPRDPNIVPRLLVRGRKRQLRRIGGVNKPIDSSYIDNVADAHLLAADTIGPGSLATGRAYFISNGEPMPLWDLVDGILAAGDVPPVKGNIPFPIAWSAGVFFELLFGLLRLRATPPMTRFLARELSTSHWFDISAARRDLGYDPKITINDGLKRLREWLHASGSTCKK